MACQSKPRARDPDAKETAGRARGLSHGRAVAGRALKSGCATAALGTSRSLRSACHVVLAVPAGFNVTDRQFCRAVRSAFSAGRLWGTLPQASAHNL